LWKLLVAITGMKSVDQIRRQTAKKRGGGDMQGNSVIANTADEANAGFEQFADAALSPAFLAELDEQQTVLLNALHDDVQRQIARQRLEGMSNEEIANSTGISVRSVERKIKLIREIWTRLLEQGVAPD
jgi:DNA-directed RNA polymerase specialized sigma24 family protein